MALSIAEKGLDGIITYNNKKDDAAAVVSVIEALGQKAAAIQLNTGDIKGFPRFLDSLKDILKKRFAATRLDFLVNNAGIGINTPYNETTEEQFDLE